MHCSIYQLDTHFSLSNIFLDVTRLAIGVLLISLEQYAEDDEVRLSISFIT